MAHLVTLAHRASSINARYTELHGLILEFSWSKLKSIGSKTKDSSCCRYEQDLAAVKSQLLELEAAISEAGHFESGTTIGIEFMEILKRYVAALGEAIDLLSRICNRMCRDGRGLEPYGDVESRRDRIAYDESIQRYKRLGQRLHYLFRWL